MSRNFSAKLARKNSKIFGIPARRAHKKLRALGQRALRMLQNVAEVDRVENAFRVRRRDHVVDPGIEHEPRRFFDAF